MDDERAAPATTVLVNGQRHEVCTEPDTVLLYVLRNHLGLKGTRFGCGLGLCGACLVLVDGLAACSCDARAICGAWNADGARAVQMNDGTPRCSSMEAANSATVIGPCWCKVL